MVMLLIELRKLIVSSRLTMLISSVKEDDVLSPTNEDKQDLLVPVKLQFKRNRKGKNKDTSALLSHFIEVIREVDATRIRMKNEAARQHELKLFQLTFGQQPIPSSSTTRQQSASINNQQQTMPVAPRAAVYSRKHST